MDQGLAMAIGTVVKHAEREQSYALLDALIPPLAILHERLTINQRERNALHTLERLRLNIEDWKKEAAVGGR